MRREVWVISLAACTTAIAMCTTYYFGIRTYEEAEGTTFVSAPRARGAPDLPPQPRLPPRSSSPTSPGQTPAALAASFGAEPETPLPTGAAPVLDTEGRPVDPKLLARARD